MTHPGTGNPTWQGWPSTQTPISAYALEQIEAAIDNGTSGAWTSFTTMNGWAARPGYVLPRLRMLSSTRVELVGVLYRDNGGNPTGSPSGTQVGTVPPGFRVPQETIVPITDNAGRALGLRLTPDGGMFIFSAQLSGSALNLNAEYPLNPPTLA